MKSCIVCNKELTRGHRTEEQWRLAKFCSNQCTAQWRTGPNHHYWKVKPSYSGIHHWIVRKLGTPSTCENCGMSDLTGKKIHWANLSGEYSRDVSDWARLCTPCHSRFDGAWFNRKRLVNGQFA